MQRRCCHELMSAALSFSLILSGCSLINPYVTWDRTKPEHEVTLDEAITYANRAKDAYKSAAGEQASWTSILGIVLIPLGAAALGMGIAQANAISTTALGLSGAGVLGVGTWLNSKPRQLAYLNGVKALTCAVDAVLPLYLPEERHKTFRQDLFEGVDPNNPSLNTAIGTVEDNISQVRSSINEVTNIASKATEIIEDAKADVRTAEDNLEIARSALTAGIQLDQEQSRVGQMLISAVDRIGAEVDIAITQTVPEVQAISGILQGLAQTSAQFTKQQGPKPGKMTGGEGEGTARDIAFARGQKRKSVEALNKLTAEAEKKENELRKRTTEVEQKKKELEESQAQADAVEQLGSAMSDLKGSVTKMSESITKITAVVNKVSEANLSAALKQCNVEPVVTDITVQPSGSLSLVKPGTTKLIISGGKAPYSAQLLEESANGPTVKQQPTAFGPVVVIQTTQDTQPGEYHVYVADSVGHDKVIQLNVKESAGKASTRGTQ